MENFNFDKPEFHRGKCIPLFKLAESNFYLKCSVAFENAKTKQKAPSTKVNEESWLFD